MATNTPNLGLLKKDPATDGLDTFNIQTMLNDNWDKIDATTGPASAATKGVVKIGSGINVDGVGVISVPTFTAPVSSVNSKTGVVVLDPSDIGAATSAQGTKADSALQTSQLGTVGGVAKQDDLSTHLATNASETVKGHVELATAAETTTGTDNTRAVHTAGLKVELDKRISHSLATAVSDFIISSGAGVFVKKTLAEVKTILGLGTAAYTASTAYATAAQGTLATNAIPSSQKGAVGGVALYDDAAAHFMDYTLQVPYAGTATGAANTYAIAAPSITTLTAGMAVCVKFNVDSTGASTLNWNGKGAKGLKKPNGSDVTNLKATGIYTLRYDGTNFILQGEGGSGNATAPDLLSGKTASTDAGDIVGTMPTKVGSATVITPSTVVQAIPQGYYDGALTSGKVDVLPSNVKSIQRGSTTVNATTVNVGISAIDLTKSVLMLSIHGRNNQYANVIVVAGALTTATNVAFYVNTAALNYSIVAWTVIEFNNVKSVQRGSNTTNLTAATIGISSVDPLKSVVFASFTTTDTGTYVAGAFPSFALSNATTISVAQNNSNNLTIRWQVIEFN